MSDFYSNLRDTVATPLLNRFNQGTITFVRYTASAPVNPWDPVPVGQSTRIEHGLKGAVNGVPKKYIDGQAILESDLLAVVAVNAAINPLPELNDIVELDGRPHKIVRFRPIPPNGVAVSWQLFLRA